MRAQRGFSLIELMIVVAIIGVLTAVAVPVYQDFIARTQAARVLTEMNDVRMEVELCLMERAQLAQQCTVISKDYDLLAQKPEIILNEDNVLASIQAVFGKQAATVLQGKRLALLRGFDGTWQCESSLSDLHRPKMCAAVE